KVWTLDTLDVSAAPIVINGAEYTLWIDARARPPSSPSTCLTFPRLGLLRARAAERAEDVLHLAGDGQHAGGDLRQAGRGLSAPEHLPGPGPAAGPQRRRHRLRLRVPAQPLGALRQPGPGPRRRLPVPVPRRLHAARPPADR